MGSQTAANGQDTANEPENWGQLVRSSRNGRVQIYATGSDKRRARVLAGLPGVRRRRANRTPHSPLAIHDSVQTPPPGPFPRRCYTRVMVRRGPELLSVSLEPDPVIEAYKKDVDRTLLRESLKLTPHQRVLKMISVLRFAEALRHSRLKPEPK